MVADISEFFFLHHDVSDGYTRFGGKFQKEVCGRPEPAPSASRAHFECMDALLVPFRTRLPSSFETPFFISTQHNMYNRPHLRTHNTPTDPLRRKLINDGQGRQEAWADRLGE